MSSDLPPSTVGPHGSGGVHVNGCATMPPDMRASHRVQIVVRGRRFEMPIATAIQHCSALAYFFGLPLEGCALGAVSLTGQATTSGVARPTMVWDLQSEDPSQDAQAIEAAMTAHYNQVAWPRAAHELQLSPASPPPIMPEAVRCISTQTTPVVWVFQFPRRPSATAATTPVDESDPADDPQLVLQPDYVGVILVHLRKMTEHDARGSDSEVPARTPGPTLSSLRWNELTWEQQLSVAQVVRSLLVIPCMAGYSWPTAVAQEDVDECSTNCRVASGLSRDSDDEVHAVGVIACGHCGTVGHESDVCPF